MENPWKNFIYRDPYILQNELFEINKFNNTRRSRRCVIHTGLLPEPYFGNKDADIILLNLNPGVADGEDKYNCVTNYFIETHNKNLLHEKQDYPFYLLDPKNESPGQEWWIKKLKPLTDNGIELKTLASEVFCLEFFPYHSKHYGYNGPILNSQLYNFYLLNKAIKKTALIIVLRSERYWIENVQNLIQNDKKRYITLNSRQNVVLSPKNLGRCTFDKILELLENKQRNAPK